MRNYTFSRIFSHWSLACSLVSSKYTCMHKYSLIFNEWIVLWRAVYQGKVVSKRLEKRTFSVEYNRQATCLEKVFTKFEVDIRCLNGVQANYWQLRVIDIGRRVYGELWCAFLVAMLYKLAGSGTWKLSNKSASLCT